MKKQILVTTSWDDGHILDLRLAGLLKKYGIKGTLYVSPKDREFSKEELLSEKDIVSLSKDFEIGAHTMTHPRLSTIDPAEAKKEIQSSKRYLERLIGKSINSFCYPGGDYSSVNVNQVAQAGFSLARTVKRFSFSEAAMPYEMPTSIHAYNHWLDAIKIAFFVRFNILKFIRFYRNWDLLAIAMFDYVLERGSVFHLWGHSWEIDNHHDWLRLDRVFKYISKNKKVKFVTNGELV